MATMADTKSQGTEEVVLKKIQHLSLDPGFAYLIFEDDESKGILHFSIGISTNPSSHLSKLQKGNPRKLCIAPQCLIPVKSMKAAQREAKGVFEKTECERREESEWFKVELYQKDETVEKFIAATNGDGEGYVSLIEEGDVTNPNAPFYITVGHSVNPSAHLSTLQKGNPRRLTIASSSMKVTNMKFTAQAVKVALLSKYNHEYRGKYEWLKVTANERDDVISQFNIVVKDPHNAIKDCGDEQGILFLMEEVDADPSTSPIFYFDHSVNPSNVISGATVICEVEVKSIRIALEAAKEAFCKCQFDEKEGRQRYKFPPQEEKTYVIKMFKAAVAPHSISNPIVKAKFGNGVGGFVYLVKENNISDPNGPLHYMVGHSANPDAEIETLQKGNPRRLSFEFKIEVKDMKAADADAKLALNEYSCGLGGGGAWFTAAHNNERETLKQTFLRAVNQHRY